MTKEDLLADFTRLLAHDWHKGGHRDGAIRTFVTRYDKARKIFSECLNRGGKERELQATLERYPVLLLNALMGGFFPVGSQRCALFSQVSLGESFRSDFAFVNANSLGAWWVFIELKGADTRLFTKKGDPTAELTHAVRQITDWRTWLKDKRAYAESLLRELQKPSRLHDYDCSDFRRDPRFLVIIGRRSMLDTVTNRRRAEMCNAMPHLEIITYDRLVDSYGAGIREQFGESNGPDILRELRA